MIKTATKLLLALSIIAATTCGAFAAAAKPLKNVLPDEALVIVWSANPATLVDSINSFTPGPQADIPPLTGNPDLAVLGPNWDSSPAAFVLMPGAPKPVPMLLFSIEADSIANLEEQQTAGTSFGNYKGYVAAIPAPGTFDDIVTTAEYQPSPEAARLMEESQLFVHCNLVALSKMGSDALAKVEDSVFLNKSFTRADGTETTLSELFTPEKAAKLVTDGRALVNNLLDEFKATDVGLSFDFEGMKIDSVCTVKKNGLVARYLVSAPTAGKLEPALPQLDHYALASWAHASDAFTKAFETDVDAICGYLLNMLEGTGEKTEFIRTQVETARASLETNRLMMGPNMGAIFSSTGGIMNVVATYELADQTLTREEVLDKLVNQMNESMSSNPQFESKIDKNFTQIQGEDITRLVVKPEGDENAVQAFKALFDDESFTTYYALTGKHLIAAIPGDNMNAALSVLKGRVDTPSLSDDPQIKSMIDKVGSDNDCVCLFVPARYVEFFGTIMAKVTNMANNAPMPLPFATPMAFGVKFEDGYKIRTRGIIPQSSIAETVTAGMGLFMMMQGAR